MDKKTPAAQRLPAFASHYLVSPSASSQYEEGGSGLVPPLRERAGWGHRGRFVGSDGWVGWCLPRGSLHAFAPEAAFFGEGASSFVLLAVRARMFA